MASFLNFGCVTDTRYDSLEEIIGGCLRKKDKARELLYKKFFGYALKVALIHNRNRETALEIVNDSFVKVFRQIDRYNPELSFKTWLGKIVVNTSIDRFRQNRKEIQAGELETFLIPDDAPDADMQLTAQDILRLLNHLPEVQRMVFSLHEIEGYSHDEIAELLKIPDNSSRVYLTRARKRLRELFEMYFKSTYEKFGN
jgi:RNA polymerase sigma-70 factor (ECF subfamily)